MPLWLATGAWTMLRKKRWGVVRFSCTGSSGASLPVRYARAIEGGGSGASGMRTIRASAVNLHPGWGFCAPDRGNSRTLCCQYPDPSSHSASKGSYGGYILSSGAFEIGCQAGSEELTRIELRSKGIAALTTFLCDGENWYAQTTHDFTARSGFPRHCEHVT